MSLKELSFHTRGAGLVSYQGIGAHALGTWRRRFHLEILGRRRFHITRAWEQDGYRFVPGLGKRIYVIWQDSARACTTLSLERL